MLIHCIYLQFGFIYLGVGSVWGGGGNSPPPIWVWGEGEKLPPPFWVWGEGEKLPPPPFGCGERGRNYPPPFWVWGRGGGTGAVSGIPNPSAHIPRRGRAQPEHKDIFYIIFSFIIYYCTHIFITKCNENNVLSWILRQLARNFVWFCKIMCRKRLFFLILLILVKKKIVI